MKTAWFSKIWIGAALLFVATSSEGAATPGHSELLLSISTSGGQGRLVCGLYDQGGWLKRPLRRASASIRGNVATCRFADLSPGRYAAGGFQDQNLNGKLDRGWTGLPKEPWCVSRGSRGTVGAPSFDAAAFALGDGTMSLSCRAK